MYQQFRAVIACVTLALVFHSEARAVAILPTPIPGVNSLPYGDFTIYSMALLNFQATGATNFPNGSPFYIPSSPGQIGPPTDFVVATFPGGNRSNASALADDAWGVSNAGSVSHYTFSTFGGPSNEMPDPGPNGFTGDMDFSWDANAGEIASRLGADDLVFWFNLNENGTESELLGQDLLAYAEVTLRDAGGVLQNTFKLTGDGSPVGNVSFDGRLDWAYVHSEITVNTTTMQFVHLGPPTPAENMSGGFASLTQNLGADNAAFGAYNPTLSNLVKSNPTWTLSVNLELGLINNGYEQLFIRGAQIGGVVNVVPEPASGVVWSILSMCGIGLSFRRRLASRTTS